MRVLGPPESGWVGGRAAAGHRGPRGRAAATRPGAGARQLLPALHAVQDRIGWISQPALNYISRRLAVPPAEAYGVATFYALYLDEAAAAGRGPRLRRHRLPDRRGGADLRRPRAGGRAGGRGGSRRPGRLAALARAWACATSPRRPDHERRRSAPRSRPQRRSTRPGSSSGWTGRPSRARRSLRGRPATRAFVSCDGSARRSRLARRLPGQRRLHRRSRRRSRSAPRPSSPRSPPRS